MSTNLVSSIAQYLTSDVVARTATSLGLDRVIVQKGMNAGAPALLAALSSLVAKPGGAEKLNSAVAQQDRGILSSLAKIVGSSDEAALINSGTDALRSLLGTNTASSLVDAVGKYAGGSQHAIRNLMGLLGPVVMAVLGQQRRGLDSSALRSLLASQNDNIATALPADLSKYLRGTGILDTITSNLEEAYREASGHLYERIERPPGMGQPAKHTSWWSWVLPALALFAVGAIAWRLLSGPHPREVALTPAPETKMATLESVQTPPTLAPTSVINAGQVDAAAVFTPLQGIKVGNIDIGALATSAIIGLRSSLETITDEATARSSAPKLASSVAEFEQLAGLTNQLSPEARRTLADAIVASRPSLDQLLDKALAIPGVGPVINPTVDSLRSKLDTLATA
jgi:hypothetical protein